MAKKIPVKQKLEEIYVIEDTFDDVLTSVNWKLLGEWLLEPVNLDQRKDETVLDEAMIEKAEAYLRYQQEESLAKEKKNQVGGELKREMTRMGANAAYTVKGQQPSIAVKFKKRLVVKKYE